MGISRRLAQSDESRDRALTKGKEKNDSVAAPDRFLTTQTQDRLNSIQPQFKTGMLNRGIALAGQTGSTAEVEAAKLQARMFISHYFQVFNLGVTRGVYPKSHRAFYQLDVNSEAVPSLVTEQEILQWGDRIKTGDVGRLAAGGAAMSNPATADVNTKVADFKTKNTSQSNLKDTYDAAQEAVEALRDEADKVIKKVWDEVETFFNEEAPPSKRNSSREWGVVYESDIDITFNFLVKDNANDAAIANATIELIETGNTKTSDVNGKATMVSNIADKATFRFTHPDYVLQEIAVDISSGAVVFEVVCKLVHV